jgi:hypothetical protein
LDLGSFFKHCGKSLAFRESIRFIVMEGTFFANWSEHLPAQNAGGRYKTLRQRAGFVAAVPSRAFRDGTGNLASMQRQHHR